jgi:hypothetical protein
LKPVLYPLTADNLKCHLKKSLIFLLLFFCLILPSRMVLSEESVSGRNQSLTVGTSYMVLRKSLVDLPVAWESKILPLFCKYQLTYGKVRHSIAFLYGRGAISDAGRKREPENNNFRLLSFSYDFTWHKRRPTSEPGFLWGLGLSLQNSEVRQRISVASGIRNEYKDQYFGLGPRFNALYTFSKREISAGIDICATTTLPGASQSTIKTEGVYSTKSYLLWLKLDWAISFNYRLSQVSSVQFAFERETWIYGRKAESKYEVRDFFSGGAFLLSALTLGISYSF